MIKNLSSYNTFHLRRRSRYYSRRDGKNLCVDSNDTARSISTVPTSLRSTVPGSEVWGSMGQVGQLHPWVHLPRRRSTGSQLGDALTPCPAHCPRVVSPMGPSPPSSHCVPNGSTVTPIVLCPQWVRHHRHCVANWVRHCPHCAVSPVGPSVGAQPAPYTDMGWEGLSPAQHRGPLTWSSQISGSRGPHGGAALVVLHFSNASPVPLCPPGFSVPIQALGAPVLPPAPLLPSHLLRLGKGSVAAATFPKCPHSGADPLSPFPGPFPGLRQSSNNNCLAAPNPSQVTSRQPTPRLNSAFLRAALTPPAPRGCAGVLPGVPSPALPFPAGPGAARCRLDQPFPALPVRG